MKVFIVEEKKEGKWEPSLVTWTAWTADLRMRLWEANDTSARVKTVEIESLDDLLYDYFRYMGYAWPDLQEAYNFLVHEVGELGDALNDDPKWKRDNPGRERSIPHEAADVMMMLLAFISQMEPPEKFIDPIEVMLQSWESKDGFNRFNKYLMHIKEITDAHKRLEEASNKESSQEA